MIVTTLEKATAAISAMEQHLPPGHVAWSLLAHARKEYGHACSWPEQEAFHLRVISEDLARAEKMIAGDERVDARS